MNSVYLKIYHPLTSFEGRVPVAKLVEYAGFFAECCTEPASPNTVTLEARDTMPLTASDVEKRFTAFREKTA